MAVGGLSRKQTRWGAIAVAVAAVVVMGLVVFHVNDNAYPLALQKYVRLIEANGGEGFSDFRIDVTKQVCPIFEEADFSSLSGRYGEAEVRSGPDSVSLLVTRQFQFMRTLIVEWGDGGCSAFVESHYL